MAGYTSNVWHIIELRIDPDPFFTSFQISPMKKRLGSKIHWNQRHLSNSFYGYYSRNRTKMFDKWNYFSNYVFIVDAYLKIPKLYGMERITTEELMDKLDIFEYRFGKYAKFSGGIWK